MEIQTPVETQLNPKNMKSDQLPIDEYAPYYKGYIQVLENVDLIEELEICLHDFIKFVQNIPMDKFDFRYAEGKWTIKDIIQHLIDAERVFSYRALRISRNDKTPLPGFEENDYVDHANANNRSLQELLTEMAVVRQATLSLFKSFSEEQLKKIGIASNNEVSVRAIGFIIIGHQKHHQKIFQQRYL
ncbi:DinB family protein [Flavobacterium granuli]|uniref:DinB family protein n=2 Tax=Flavobacterium granuli TaxID=280093 RepID=A0A1M5P157_9FLAO|nr:DinB family protein [Flavobacterium granuli]SHG95511.1 DinB superfamily protein [Flavobacterium granuli]